MPELRLRRLESLLREKIGTMISMGEIKDPRVERLTTITEVSLSRDMGHAKVYVSRYGDAETLKDCVDALNHGAGFIQRVLAKQISLRVFPKLTFIVDESIARGFRIAAKLREIAR
jgi:ribosome-binding factor A